MIVKAEAGEWIGTFIKRVQNGIEVGSSGHVQAEFNGIVFTISKLSLLDDLFEVYDLKRQLSQYKERE